MANLSERMTDLNRAICDDVRERYIAGSLQSAEVRSALTPDADLRHEYDEAMKLIHSLTYACAKLREENDRLRLANWVNERIIQLGCESEKVS